MTGQEDQFEVDQSWAKKIQGLHREQFHVCTCQLWRAYSVCALCGRLTKQAPKLANVVTPTSFYQMRTTRCLSYRQTRPWHNSRSYDGILCSSAIWSVCSRSSRKSVKNLFCPLPSGQTTTTPSNVQWILVSYLNDHLAPICTSILTSTPSVSWNTIFSPTTPVDWIQYYTEIWCLCEPAMPGTTSQSHQQEGRTTHQALTESSAHSTLSSLTVSNTLVKEHLAESSCHCEAAVQLSWSALHHLRERTGQVCAGGELHDPELCWGGVAARASHGLRHHQIGHSVSDTNMNYHSLSSHE